MCWIFKKSAMFLALQKKLMVCFKLCYASRHRRVKHVLQIPQPIVDTLNQYFPKHQSLHWKASALQEVDLACTRGFERTLHPIDQVKLCFQPETEKGLFLQVEKSRLSPTPGNFSSNIGILRPL